MQKLTGIDIHEAFLLDHPTARPTKDLTKASRLEYEKLAQGLNIKLGISRADETLYFLALNNSNSPDNGVWLTELRDINSLVLMKCWEDDEFTLHLLRGGREIGGGHYRMLQSWQIDIVAEYGECHGLYMQIFAHTKAR